VLRSDRRQIILNCSRQAGKSTISALLALHTAVYTPRALILLVAKTLTQSKELFLKMKVPSFICSLLVLNHQLLGRMEKADILYRFGQSD
jgi:hypothetical protein